MLRVYSYIWRYLELVVYNDENVYVCVLVSATRYRCQHTHTHTQMRDRIGEKHKKLK